MNAISVPCKKYINNYNLDQNHYPGNIHTHENLSRIAFTVFRGFSHFFSPKSLPFFFLFNVFFSHYPEISFSWTLNINASHSAGVCDHILLVKKEMVVRLRPEGAQREDCAHISADIETSTILAGFQRREKKKKKRINKSFTACVGNTQLRFVVWNSPPKFWF